MRRFVLLGVLAAGHPALASPLGDALARHSAADVDALRRQRDEVAARCTLAAVYAQRGDLGRAHLYFDGCLDAELPADIGVTIRAHARETTRRLRASDLAELSINTRPAGLLVETDALPGETFAAPRDIWVSAGAYAVTARQGAVVITASVVTEPRKRTPVYLAAPTVTTPAARDQAVDFAEETATEPQQAGPPPGVKHKSLIRGKYAGPTASRGPGADAIADPLARAATPPRRTRTWWLGVRAGVGLADDDERDVGATGVAAVAARLPLARAWFLAARLDYGLRGGGGDPAGTSATRDGATDALGASVGAALQLLRSRALDVAVLGQLRGDVRFDGTRPAMQGAHDVARFGAGVAAGIELAPLATPLTVGIRVEQGLTALAGDARDRLLMLELGVDWR